jgi:PEP-CTERM motif
LAIVWVSNQAEGAAIHHAHDASLTDHASYSTWSEYLMGGPTVWSSVAHPPLTQGIEASMWKAIKSDPPPNIDAVVQFFFYRQSVDRARFDYYHPKVAVALSKIKAEEATPTAVTTTSTTTSPTDQAQELNPAAIPEPATLLLAVGMAGYALWWRRRRA